MTTIYNSSLSYLGAELQKKSGREPLRGKTMNEEKMIGKVTIDTRYKGNPTYSVPKSYLRTAWEVSLEICDFFEQASYFKIEHIRVSWGTKTGERGYGPKAEIVAKIRNYNSQTLTIVEAGWEEDDNKLQFLTNFHPWRVALEQNSYETISRAWLIMATNILVGILEKEVVASIKVLNYARKLSSLANSTPGEFSDHEEAGKQLKIAK